VLTGSRVTAALERLAERRVSGVLEIEGNPAGTIYLDQGQITFARASWIPDLSARLPGALPPSAASPDLMADPDRPDRDIGSMLVRRKYLSRDHLQAILCSIIVDAALVLMMPADPDAFVSDVRFAAPGAHWAGAFASLCVDFVLAEAGKLAEQVARRNLARTKPVQLRDLGGPSAVLTREQWAVACAIDGTRSVQDLAWQCGLALYDTIERVGGLVQAGVCAPCAPGVPAGTAWAPAPRSGRDEPGPAALPVLSPTRVLSPMPAPPAASWLPRRSPGGQQTSQPVMSAPVWVAAPEAPSDFAAAQPDLLRRVLDGLRKLS
jgi:hypothetical protein